VISQRNEKRGDVLAMAPVTRCERGTRTHGSESVRGKLEGDLVRVGIGPAYVSACARLLDDYVFDRMTADIVVSTQICSGSEQAPERAVVQGRECFSER
jgi:hypothetical protein